VTFWEFANNNPFTACVLAFFAMWASLGGAAMIAMAIGSRALTEDEKRLRYTTKAKNTDQWGKP
jgi:hypothetical protein